MATYDKDTKFYWLQLKEDFFDDDAIEWLEEQPNGTAYSLFYLKLCLKSLRSNGILIRKVGHMLIPYDEVKLGEMTKTPSDTVLVAMNLLLKIGLVQKLENGALYMTQVERMIGSKSMGAFKKQQQRMRGKENPLELPSGEVEKSPSELPEGQEVDKCPPDIEKEKEIDTDTELEKRKEKKEKYGTFDNVLLTPAEYDRLKNDFSNYQAAIDFLSAYIEENPKYKKKNHNLALRRWVFDAVREKEIKQRELDQREARAAAIQQGKPSAYSPAGSNVFLEIGKDEGIFGGGDY